MQGHLITNNSKRRVKVTFTENNKRDIMIVGFDTTNSTIIFCWEIFGETF